MTGIFKRSGETPESEFTDFLCQVMELCGLHSVDGSLNYVFMDWRHMAELLAAGRQVDSELKSVCVWVKDKGGMGSPYRNQHELSIRVPERQGKSSQRCPVRPAREAQNECVALSRGEFLVSFH